jgi:hypothetical protein
METSRTGAPMTPEKIAEAVKAVLTPTQIRIDPRCICPFCAECDAAVDPRLAAINDGVLGWRMADGSHYFVGLCQRCIASLDAASHSETVRRLRAIRSRAFS